MTTHLTETLALTLGVLQRDVASLSAEIAEWGAKVAAAGADPERAIEALRWADRPLEKAAHLAVAGGLIAVIETGRAAGADEREILEHLAKTLQDELVRAARSGSRSTSTAQNEFAHYKTQALGGYHGDFARRWEAALQIKVTL